MTTLHLIETMTTLFTRISIITSEVFTVTAILWSLNFMSELFKKIYHFSIGVYVFGQMCGEFYFTHLHDMIMELLYNMIITTTKVIGYTAGFCVYVYHNRAEYVKALNNVRNTIGAQFVYA